MASSFFFVTTNFFYVLWFLYNNINPHKKTDNYITKKTYNYL